MAFNFKKHSNNVSLLERQVRMDVSDRRKKHTLDAEVDTQTDYSSFQSLKEKYIPAIVDKYTYYAEEIKRRFEPIDVEKNHKQKLTNSKNYFRGTSPDQVRNNKTFEEKSNYGQKVKKYRENLIKIFTNEKYSQDYNALPYVELGLSSIKDLPSYDLHFSKQNNKCFFCGRDLYTGHFRQGKIQLEHLVDKANWMKQIADGQDLLIKFFDSNPQDLPSLKAVEDDAAYIKAVIESNAVNCYQNWMFADAECNCSKMDLPSDVFIDFMQQIHNVNTPEIISKNKKLFEIAKQNNSNYREVDPVKVSLTNAAKSYELYHEFLSDLIENSGVDIDLGNILYSHAGDTPDDILNKIDELQLALQLPVFKDLIEGQTYKSRAESFKVSIYEKKGKDFKDKKTLYISKDDCFCAICGRKNTDSSPLNRNQGFCVFDVTAELDNFQWQLVHTDCAGRCQNISVRTIRFLAQQITKYTPKREQIIKEVGTDINNIYKTFLRHLESLRTELGEVKAAFNFYRFIRRGGR